MEVISEQTKKYREYLLRLRDEGPVNMFEAAPYLQKAFPELDKKQSEEVLVSWMESFGK